MIIRLKFLSFRIDQRRVPAEVAVYGKRFAEPVGGLLKSLGVARVASANSGVPYTAEGLFASTADTSGFAPCVLQSVIRGTVSAAPHDACLLAWARSRVRRQ